MIYQEHLTEQVKDIVNIVQLLEVELETNEDDEHIIRTVSIIEKMLQEHLKSLQQLNINSDYGNNPQSSEVL